MTNILTLRPKLKSSTPTTFWPSRGFDETHMVLSNNAHARKHGHMVTQSFILKSDIITDKRYIRFDPDGTWVHSNTGNTREDKLFHSWLKGNIQYFAAPMEYSRRTYQPLVIFGKMGPDGFVVYFLVSDGSVVFDNAHLAAIFPQDHFALAEQYKNPIEFTFYKHTLTPIEQYYARLPMEQVIGFPLINDSLLATTTSLFETLAFTSYRRTSR